ncbi:MAG: hypothetical protein ACOCXA_03950 [Planctomycetota bacterium]
MFQLLSDVPIYAIVGSSHLLRAQALHSLLASWSGEVQRGCDPEHLAAALLDLQTPSMFGGGGCRVFSLDERVLIKQQDQLATAAAQTANGSHLVLLLDKLLPKRAAGKLPADRLGAVLRQRDALIEVAPPDARALVEWLIEQFLASDHGVERPREVAAAIVQHRGADPDVAILTWQMVRDYAGDEPVRPEHVAALLDDIAESPVYEFTNAFVGGEARKALAVLYGGRGLHPDPALAALANELRKMLACLEHEDDKEVYRRAGLRGRPGRGMYYTRKRATGLGRRCLARLLDGVLQTQSRLRQTGTDPLLAMETLILHAQRLLR